MLRATNLNAGASESSEIAEIGPGSYCGGGAHITPSLGLCDGSGARLQAVLEGYGQETSQSWIDFDTTYDLAQGTTGMMSGAAFYHWVAIRGVRGDKLWIANSAPGYQGIWDELSRADWNRLGGWSVVWLV